MYRLYSNNIELIDINSVTEQEMQSFANKFFKSMWTNWYTHTFVHTLIKEALKATSPFLCNEFSGVHSPTCCRYILQSQHGHCKDTHFLIFLLKIHKDCDNLILLGTRSHIFGPRNKMNPAACLTEWKPVL